MPSPREPEGGSTPQAPAKMNGLAESIDHLIAVEFRRGGAPNGFIEPLYRAARELTGKPLAWAAAEQLYERVGAGDTVYIATGHVHPIALPAGETDGPLGAVILARALVMAQSASVVLLCEDAVVETLRATCSAAGLMVRPEDQLPMPRSVAIQAFPTDPEVARALSKDMAAKAKAVVTIEKIGPSASGLHLTASGSDVSPHVAKIEILVEAARALGRLTIGIGDLGNEIGMASITDAIVHSVKAGTQIACVTATDFLIVAGCSNWGAYGVAAVLAAMHGDDKYFHNSEIERRMIEAICAAGSVDGFSAAPTLEVDGGGWRFHAAFVTMLREVVKLSLDMSIPERHRFTVRM